MTLEHLLGGVPGKRVAPREEIHGGPAVTSFASCSGGMNVGLPTRKPSWVATKAEPACRFASAESSFAIPKSRIFTRRNPAASASQ
jgi:hypothetical protein